ncbi:hypothetical protein [Streptomyces albireticuli]|nr:hypothetical protein [Streptomyces albireticuli]MCD9142844.1 hypothetical protein [Streptomyces albireticuli]MCD9162837.1 hypothetical protein [Streptomyces albireticuli]MCD9192397.1 hypothetical protein [Streptomyces albireticuli]
MDTDPKDADAMDTDAMGTDRVDTDPVDTVGPEGPADSMDAVGSARW